MYQQKATYKMWEDMQGKRYAISRFGSGSHLMWPSWIRCSEAGRPTNFQFCKIGNLTVARAAFAAGEADVFLWEKFMTKPYVDNGEFRRIGETTTPWPCFMIAARNERIRRSGKALKAMIEVISKPVAT
ncbi:MAG: hypothetical protein R2788_07645 [Saprospiraceae bacterium]